MANIIAIVWDFDQTLVKGYMQDPIFKYYNVDSKKFWKEVSALPDYYNQSQHVKVNRDTIYLNHFINYTKKGIFKGLNNQMLRDFGKELTFYPGVPEIFEKTKKMIEDNPKYREFDIKVEHYIVSTGMSEIIRGSAIMPYIDDIWGCELIEDKDIDGNMILSEIGYTIDNTSKTKALFEINKGINKRKDLNVNSKIPHDLRRVQFSNMIYIADGPSDVPAFSVINQYDGSTLAVYPHGNYEAMKQVEQLRKDQRIDMFVEADYQEDTTAYMWICNKILEIAEGIRDGEKEKLAKYAGNEPKHLNN